MPKRKTTVAQYANLDAALADMTNLNTAIMKAIDDSAVVVASAAQALADLGKAMEPYSRWLEDLNRVDDHKLLPIPRQDPTKPPTLHDYDVYYNLDTPE